MESSLKNEGVDPLTLRQNEYSTSSILKNAKTEKLLMDMDMFKVRSKKEFSHDVVAKSDINNYFG